MQKALLTIFLVLAQSGCYRLFVEPYGFVHHAADNVHADNKSNYIPPNAPSIMTGYWGKDVGHEGIDIVSDVGSAVLSPASGVVTASYFEPMYGHQIYIDHGKSEQGVFVKTRLIHLDKRLVKEGDKVKRGQQIGKSGRTGLLAGGLPHLHFEVLTALNKDQYEYQTSNPHLYWVEGPGVISCYDNNRQYPQHLFKITYPLRCLEED